MIRLLALKNGYERLSGTAKQGVSVSEICEIAERMVFNGDADYARVEVNGEIYSEYEV